MIEIRKPTVAEVEAVADWANISPESVVIADRGRIFAAADEYGTVSLAPWTNPGVRAQSQRAAIEDGLSALFDVVANLTPRDTANVGPEVGSGGEDDVPPHIDVQQAMFYRNVPYKTINLLLWHDKGRSILTLDDDGAFRPLDSDSGGALADLLEDI